MIDPKLLTEENGFVNGVAVAIRWSHYVSEDELYIFHNVYKDEICITPGGIDDSCEINVNKIKSIRPLTGPMSIWNFAPEWADVCFHGDMGSIQFYSNDQIDQFGDMVFDPEHDKESTRPFWAKETE